MKKISLTPLSVTFYVVCLALLCSIIMGIIFLFQKGDEKFSQTVGAKTEMLKRYKLIRPLVFDTSATDVAGLHLEIGKWYLITQKSENVLIPISLFQQDDFIETCVKRDKMAIIDTMFPHDETIGKIFPSLNKIKETEILCFKPGFELIPSFNQYGYVTVGCLTTLMVK